MFCFSSDTCTLPLFNKYFFLGFDIVALLSLFCLNNLVAFFIPIYKQYATTRPIVINPNDSSNHCFVLITPLVLSPNMP